MKEKRLRTLVCAWLSGSAMLFGGFAENAALSAPQDAVAMEYVYKSEATQSSTKADADQKTEKDSDNPKTHDRESRGKERRGRREQGNDNSRHSNETRIENSEVNIRTDGGDVIIGNEGTNIDKSKNKGATINSHNKTDDHSVHDSYNETNTNSKNTTDDHSTNITNTETNIGSKNNITVNEKEQERRKRKFVLDGEAQITHPVSGDKYKVQISGWTNTTKVNAKIGTRSYTIDITNPKKTKTNFSQTFSLPTSTTGTLQVLIDAVDPAQADHTKRIGSGSITIAKEVEITGNLVTATFNASTRKLSVSGWAKNANQVKIALGGTVLGTLPVSNTASAQPPFKGEFSVPSGMQGTLTVTATASNTTAADIAPQTWSKQVVIPAPLTITGALNNPPTYNASNRTVTVSGWAKNANQVRITFGGKDMGLASLTNTGSAQPPFTKTFTVPDGVSGTITITATASNTTASNVKPQSWSIQVGIPAPLAITGALNDPTYNENNRTVTVSGWAKNANQVRITFNGKDMGLATLTNTGSAQPPFTKTFTVPDGVAGTIAITATASNTTASNVKPQSWSKQVVIPAPLEITGTLNTPTYNASNRTVTVSGWAKNANQVRITFDGKDMGLATLTNTGSAQPPFTKTFTIANGISGLKTVTATASNTAASNVKPQTWSKQVDIPVYSPEFSDVSVSVVNYNHIRLTGRVIDRDDTSQNLTVRVDVGGGIANIQANKGDHRFDEDIEINIEENKYDTYRVILTALNIGGGSDTTLDKGSVRVESPIINISGMRLATGIDGIAARALVTLHKENRRNGTYYVTYNSGPKDSRLDTMQGWVSKRAVGDFPCRWGNPKQAGKFFTYPNEYATKPGINTLGHEEKIWGTGIIIDDKNGRYQVRYNGEDEVKDRWISKEYFG